MGIKKYITGLILSLSSASAMAAPVVFLDFNGDGLQDTTTSVTLGNSVTAELYVSNVDSLNGGLISWGTEINFTNSLLSASAYSIIWPLPGINNNIDNPTGTTELLASTFTAQTGTFKLADISFDTLNTGLASISLGQLYPDLSTFSGFTAADGLDYDLSINFSLAAATINVTAVPVPGALILFLSGLVGLTGLKHRKQ